MAEPPISSRIFVNALPPTFTEAEFKKHFARGGSVTDAKIFPNRRIGYIGYKTPQEAQDAVKYFHKTFIRMSRIGVEIARPPAQTAELQRTPTQAARRESGAEIKDTEAGGAKRKRDDEAKEAEDPKLKEFLEAYKPKSKRKAWENEAVEGHAQTTGNADGEAREGVADGQSDAEYEVVPKKAKRVKVPNESETMSEPLEIVQPTVHDEPTKEEDPKPTTSDADWARSRTSRLLGLVDEDEEMSADLENSPPPTTRNSKPQQALSDLAQISAQPVATSTIVPDTDTPPSKAESTNRLFVRNLPFNVQEDDLTAEFEPYGELEEVHLCTDKDKDGIGKGFAFIQYSTPEAAERAREEKDGQTFQGRLLHVLSATAKRVDRRDEAAIAALPPEKQRQLKLKIKAANEKFRWNALYMNADAVVSSVAERFGLSKSDVLDPTSSDAAVKQAHAETLTIQETKSYFRQHGVDLDAFKKSQRGDTAILIKNIPADCSKDELMQKFEEHGDVKRFLMPPNGVIAIVEMANVTQSSKAYQGLAYKRVKNSMLFLEKAPKNLFSGKSASVPSEVTPDGVTKPSASELKDTADAQHTVADTTGTATLFVRNLNFTTTTDILTQTFKPLSGFLSALVKTKTDPKKPGQLLSMGFGFLEFASTSHAQAALKAMDGHTLEAHKLQLRASHKGTDAAEDRRKADAAKRVAGKRTKVIIKNLPFEASKKDVRALFGAYGQLRSVRVPKKVDGGARGFGFADFTTPKEAESAMDALRDTHLLGRKLVLDFAEGEAEDAEEEIGRMQRKIGGQVNKVALQKLTGGGRRKFTTGGEEE
ncbi:Multiple RNA-binding domain-containing protein 1 [Friedmanniomyces endolithicus]|uniref:Multiple RNA-binding domain-containing protein 1 n=1 Tax=Friedmanniomyces endolithicus TaxID=329885 RepID=A0AAN6FD00_9PEZI|nr:Multiple RNA-binding domain-containing protein 1 [Friedmanniomyces endolithicus]KAK0902619.1 Multiple RNA-binding domain-containing protein 1 [Friedmanniomyces endolithicus]KAK0983619.1 Multiple RNA-binding domain-containing protein 1 [Friedmanniomyces endolithicus]KAK0985695.1 Multiple RNA-binding domain-containing protein 1 [Friedmanniomyces endolithicus]KAK1043528.1 Multiple RNA-binding domain-containing protein 1 [Friedmanniomyces endolithicus]